MFTPISRGRRRHISPPKANLKGPSCDSGRSTGLHPSEMQFNSSKSPAFSAKETYRDQSDGHGDIIGHTPRSSWGGQSPAARSSRGVSPVVYTKKRTSSLGNTSRVALGDGRSVSEMEMEDSTVRRQKPKNDFHERLVRDGFPKRKLNGYGGTGVRKSESGEPEKPSAPPLLEGSRRRFSHQRAQDSHITTWYEGTCPPPEDSRRRQTTAPRHSEEDHRLGKRIFADRAVDHLAVGRPPSPHVERRPRRASDTASHGRRTPLVFPPGPDVEPTEQRKGATRDPNTRRSGRQTIPHNAPDETPESTNRFFSNLALSAAEQTRSEAASVDPIPERPERDRTSVRLRSTIEAQKRTSEGSSRRCGSAPASSRARQPVTRKSHLSPERLASMPPANGITDRLTPGPPSSIGPCESGPSFGLGSDPSLPPGPPAFSTLPDEPASNIARDTANRHHVSHVPLAWDGSIPPPICNDHEQHPEKVRRERRHVEQIQSVIAVQDAAMPHTPPRTPSPRRRRSPKPEPEVYEGLQVGKESPSRPRGRSKPRSARTGFTDPIGQTPRKGAADGGSPEPHKGGRRRPSAGPSVHLSGPALPVSNDHTPLANVAFPFRIEHPALSPDPSTGRSPSHRTRAVSPSAAANRAINEPTPLPSVKQKGGKGKVRGRAEGVGSEAKTAQKGLRSSSVGANAKARKSNIITWR